MNIDETLIDELTKNIKISKYSMVLENKVIPLTDVLISKSMTPLKKPNTRGGVYFSDTVTYRIRATTSDVSIIPLISKTMLGPNPEFSEIKIITNVEKNNLDNVSLFTNLTNSMESKSKIELDMVIVRTSKN